MEATEASLTGTLRIIAVLVLVWVLLRLLRSRLGGRGGPGQHRATADDRAKGEVRIERVSDPGKPHGAAHGPVTDADYEEIK